MASARSRQRQRRRQRFITSSLSLAECTRVALLFVPTVICLWTSLELYTQRLLLWPALHPIPDQPQKTPRRRQFPSPITAVNYHNADIHIIGNASAVYSNLQEGVDGDLLPTLRMQDDDVYALSFRLLRLQTLCPLESPLLNMDNHHVDLWTIRLLYLAIHEHQNAAAPLTLLPSSAPHPAPLDAVMCPADTKFIVAAVGNMGLGANLRLGAVTALQAALATNRTLLLLNHVPHHAIYLRQPWSLVQGCRQHQSHHDYQCLFLPSSLCVLSPHELQSAHELTKTDIRHVLQQGMDPQPQARTILMRLSFRPTRTPPNLPHLLYEKARRWQGRLLLSRAGSAAAAAAQWRHVLHQALENIQRGNDTTIDRNTSYYYHAKQSRLHQAMLLYVARPNAIVTEALRQTRDVMRLSSNFMNSNIVGLPIRASDKCNEESECFDFATHLEAAISRLRAQQQQQQQQHSTSVVGPLNVIVTSESSHVMAELQRYAAAAAAAAPPPSGPAVRFVVNARDRRPDTGYMKELDHNINATAWEISIAALTSLHAQLHAGSLTLGNCCSSFHLLLADLIAAGCGMSVKNNFHCLQDHPDPQYRLCCGWDKSEKCRARRRQMSGQSAAAAG